MYIYIYIFLDWMIWDKIWLRLTDYKPRIRENIGPACWPCCSDTEEIDKFLAVAKKHGLHIGDVDPASSVRRWGSVFFFVFFFWSALTVCGGYTEVRIRIDCNSRLSREWITRGVWRLQGSSTMEDMQEFRRLHGALGLSKRARNIN